MRHPLQLHLSNELTYLIPNNFLIPQFMIIIAKVHTWIIEKHFIQLEYLASLVKDKKYEKCNVMSNRRKNTNIKIAKAMN